MATGQIHIESEGIAVNRTERENWIINIENCADRIASEIRYETVRAVLEKYGARCIEDLRPHQYNEVFSELFAIEADLK